MPKHSKGVHQDLNLDIREVAPAIGFRVRLKELNRVENKNAKIEPKEALLLRLNDDPASGLLPEGK